MAFVRQLHPISRDVDPHTIYADVEFPPREDRPYLALNFVTSVDGHATVDGRASGLGSAVDRDVMRQLRARADALLVGAGTLRAEPIDPRVPAEAARLREAAGRSPQPLFVLMTAFGMLPERKRFHPPDVQALILTGGSANLARLREIDPDADVVVLGDTRIDPIDAMRHLRSRGVGSVLCEGGPTLAGSLVAAGVVDELFVTVAPSLVGGSGLRLLEGALGAATDTISLDLLSVFEQDSELFLRYHLRR